jgi:putative FmdB family regulatory protein
LPTYQYRCTECGHAFEEFQSFTDDALTACPVCGGRLRKLFNAVGVVFKGSGFYRNDSRTTSKEPASTTSSSSSSDTSSSSSPSSSSTGSGSDSSSSSGDSSTKAASA